MLASNQHLDVIEVQNQDHIPPSVEWILHHLGPALPLKRTVESL